MEILLGLCTKYHKIWGILFEFVQEIPQQFITYIEKLKTMIVFERIDYLFIYLFLSSERIVFLLTI
jgi:hypothetical protein